MCVSGIGDPLPKRQTIGICDGHDDLSSCWTVPEAIKFDEKPICVRIDISKWVFLEIKDWFQKKVQTYIQYIYNIQQQQYIDATTDHITPCSRMRARGKKGAWLLLCTCAWNPPFQTLDPPLDIVGHIMQTARLRLYVGAASCGQAITACIKTVDTTMALCGVPADWVFLFVTLPNVSDGHAKFNP